MRTVYARAESAVALSAGERVVGVVERPGMLTEFCIGQSPDLDWANWQGPSRKEQIRAYLASPLGALVGRKPTRLVKRRDRTHAGRERKRARNA